jgi:hypothetical protein
MDENPYKSPETISNREPGSDSRSGYRPSRGFKIFLWGLLAFVVYVYATEYFGAWMTARNRRAREHREAQQADEPLPPDDL